MPPNAINIGPFTIHLYGLIIGFSILIGWSLVKKRAHIYKIKKEVFDSWATFIPIILSIFFARIYHVVDYWDIYSQNPTQIIAIQNGGLGIWGAIFGGIVGIIIFSKINKINYLNLLDLVVPSMVLGQAIGRIGNWVNQEGFGPPTNLPWGVYIAQENRPQEYLLNSKFHPTFFYEAIVNLIIFFILIYFSKIFKDRGQIFGLYIILYSLNRFYMEFFRIDTWTISTIKIAQIISLVGIVLGTWLFLRQNKG